MFARVTARTRAVLIGLAIVPLLASVAWLVWNRLRDPLDVIGRPAGAVHVASDRAYEVTTAAGELRIFRDVVLESANVGAIHLTTSQPRASTRPLPVVMILAGLNTGRKSLAVIPEHGEALLVGFEYPYDPEDWSRGDPIREARRVRRAILSVPMQVVTALRHLHTWSGVGTTRALLGYSFGAQFVPATQRVAMKERAAFDAVAMAYGGVDIGALIEANVTLEPRWIVRPFAELLESAVHAMEAARHLPELQGQFLVIRGSRDDRIPPSLSQRLADLTPEPKEVVTIDAGHMGPDAPAVTAEVVRLTREWLERIGVLEP